MTEPARRLKPSAGMGFVAALLILSAVLCLVFPLFAWYGHHRHGNWGIAAAAVALAVCWTGATLALVVVRLSRKAPVNGLLGSIFFRMGFPLIAAVYLDMQNGRLAQAGVMGMIVVYYLIALAVETVLSLFVASRAKQDSTAV